MFYSQFANVRHKNDVNGSLQTSSEFIKKNSSLKLYYIGTAKKMHEMGLKRKR